MKSGLNTNEEREVRRELAVAGDQLALQAARLGRSKLLSRQASRR